MNLRCDICIILGRALAGAAGGLLVTRLPWADAGAWRGILMFGKVRSRVEKGAEGGISRLKEVGEQVVGRAARAGSAASSVANIASAAVSQSQPITAASAVGNQVRRGSLAVAGAGMEAALNTRNFFADSGYREEVALPHLKAQVRKNSSIVQGELRDSDEIVRLLWRYGQGEEDLNAAQKAEVKGKIKDLAKAIPALGIFLLPGGVVLLPLAAKILPFDLFPSAFYGDPTLRKEMPAMTSFYTYNS